MIPEILDRESFAAAISMHRDRLKLTQAEAAELCKVSPRAWKNWEGQTGGEPKWPTQVGVLTILAAASGKRK